MSHHRIVFLGAGNLATRLSVELKKKGYAIEQVYSRTTASARTLANRLQSSFTTAPGKIISDADIYFVALKDSVIDDVLSQVSFGNQLIVHCSGSLPLSSLANYSNNIGVFYPLQTFSVSQEVNFKEIPIFVEANSEKSEAILLHLGKILSENVSLLNSEKRQFLHISAVFSCNFVNHFYTIASKLLKLNEISFDVLHPLIKETAFKVMRMEPEKAQTGPAVRFDQNIIAAHLNALNAFPEYKKLYREVSESIFNYHKQLHQ